LAKPVLARPGRLVGSIGLIGLAGLAGPIGLGGLISFTGTPCWPLVPGLAWLPGGPGRNGLASRPSGLPGAVGWLVR
jgi:hypothetical protein